MYFGPRGVRYTTQNHRYFNTRNLDTLHQLYLLLTFVCVESSPSHIHGVSLPNIDIIG